MLAFSKSYIFRMFFKQFFGICLFGVTHGLVLLPVVLSLIGPPTHKHPGHGAAKAADADNLGTPTGSETAKPAAVAVEMSSGEPVAVPSSPLHPSRLQHEEAQRLGRVGSKACCWEHRDVWVWSQVNSMNDAAAVVGVVSNTPDLAIGVPHGSTTEPETGKIC